MLAVLALLAVMLVLVSSNARTLGHLQREIKRVNQREQQKFGERAKPPAPATNSAAARPESP